MYYKNPCDTMPVFKKGDLVEFDWKEFGIGEVTINGKIYPRSQLTCIVLGSKIKKKQNVMYMSAMCYKPKRFVIFTWDI
ncbi:MAG: hypothetical protein Q8P81_03525 [Nanoarchaeota archaeon]|nr:hypothetical protein [Nanoarchaeota archaeon]